MTKGTVITKLKGGLGNQMLQYAAGYTMASRLGRALVLDLDYYKIDKFIGNTHRQYELPLLGVEAPQYKGILSNLFITAVMIKFPAVRHKMPALGLHYITDADTVDFSALSNGNHRVYMDGYWTHLAWFGESRDALCSIFDFDRSLKDRNAALAGKMMGEHSVAIHVRRTDYLLPSSKHRVLEMDYYQTAVDRLKQVYPDAVFYIFGDDHQWIREQFPLDGERFVLIDHNTGSDSYIDMGLMTKCENLVISNSTFSWWGAFLNKRKGMVFAPDNWLTRDKSHLTTKTFIPSEWIVLP